MSRWRAAIESNPDLQDFNQWPVIEVDTLPKEKRKAFITNCRMVVMALEGTPLKDIAKQFNRHPSRVTTLLNRCFDQTSGQYPLTSALVPYSQVKSHRRLSPLPSLSSPRGAAGSLTLVLRQIPDIKQRLDQVIESRIKGKKEIGPITPAVFHGIFKQLLAEHDWPSDNWPYTSIDLGRETLRKYLHRRTEELSFQNSIKKQARVDIQKISATKDWERLFGRVEIDAQKIDFFGRLDLVLNEKLIPLRLARSWLYVAIEVSTDCILGYILSDTKQPSRWDVLRLFGQCQRPWRPMDFVTPEFKYEPGACFPSGLPEAPSMIFHQVALDNAWAHHSNIIEEFLVEKQGATVHMGHAGQPTERNWIEHTFDLVNKRLSHRFPSTSGSSVLDPKREPAKNRKNPPHFTYTLFMEALEIVLTQHNLIPQAGRLGGASPLELLRHKLCNHWSPYLPDYARNQLSPFEIKERLPVKVRSDSKARHVNLKGEKYSLSSLKGLSFDDKEVDVVYDFRDIRHANAFNLSGNHLGIIHAPKSWQTYAHSVNTRDFIKKLVQRERLRTNDPLSAALLHSLENASKQTYAQHALRLYTEYIAGEERVTSIGGATLNNDTGEAYKTRVRRTDVYQWTSRGAYHG